MNKYVKYISAAVLIALAGCNGRDFDITGSDEDSRIYLAAEVSVRPQTKSPYVPVVDDDTYSDSPTYEDPLYAAVWASSEAYQFVDGQNPGSESNPSVAMHTVATFQNRGPQLLSDMIYSKGGHPIYFVAFSPQAGWGCSDDGTKSWFTFDGSQDVMFADQVEGKYGNKDEAGNLKWPVLRFHHILTWIRFEIIAENEDVSMTWGKLLDISIASKNKAEINLGSAYDEDNPDAHISFTSDVTDMPLYHNDADSDTPFPGSTPYEIPYDKADEAAYVLCAPVTAMEYNPDRATEPIEEYILTVKTENREQTVPIDLKISDSQYFTGTTMGRQFTIRLIFKMGDNITVAARSEDWNTGGIIEGTFDEI